MERQPTGAPRDARVARLLTSVALLALAVTMVVAQRRVRQSESWLLAVLAQHAMRLDVTANSLRPIVYVTMPALAHFSSPYWIGLEVTSECTVAWLLAPLLFVAGVVVLGRRLTVHGVVIATAVTALVLIVVNLVRLGVILVATHWWGLAGGYRWSHEVYGSLITVAGVGGGVALFLKLVVRYSRPRPSVAP